MPQLGIEDNRLASVSGMPRLASSVGIRKATPLMKRKEVAVTPNETARITQRVDVPSWPLVSGSVVI
jgi:hypothetical protein